MFPRSNVRRLAVVAVAILTPTQVVGPAAARADENTAGPRGPRDLVVAVQVAAGSEHTCVLMSDGLIYCAGDNELGQLGWEVRPDGTLFAPISPPLEDPLEPGEYFVDITAGNGHTMALTNLGHVYGWGDNSSGQLGVAELGWGCENCVLPTPQLVHQRLTGIGGTAEDLSPGEHFISVSAGGTNTFGVTYDGSLYRLYGWGANFRSQLGLGGAEGEIWGEGLYAYLPVLIASSSSNDFTEIAAGGGDWVDPTDNVGHTCMRLADGQVKCWGDRYWGQTGTISTFGDITPHTTPALISTTYVTPNNYTTVRAGDLFTCGLHSGGNLYCWGSNEGGQLGYDSMADYYTKPRYAVKGPDGGTLTGIVSLAAGDAHCCGVTASGEMYCWGENSQGQIGDGTWEDVKRHAVQVVGGLAFSTSIAPANAHTCAVTQSGDLYSWGFNSSGQFGRPITGYDNYLVPTGPAGLPRLRGDLDNNGVVDGQDIAPFVLILTDTSGLYEEYRFEDVAWSIPSVYCAPDWSCSPYNADCNVDGLIDLADIAPFVSVLLDA